jgi:hypothetical protein
MPIDLSKYGATIMSPSQYNAQATSSPNGFSFNLNRTSTNSPTTSSTPQANYGSFGGGGSTSFSNRAVTGTYGSAQEQTAADNRIYQQSLAAQAQRQLQQDQFSHQSAMQRAAWDRQDQMRDSLLSNMNAVGTWGTNAPPMPRIQMQEIPFQSAGSPTAQIQMPDLSAAQNAAFARAKDREGQLAQGALQGLRSQLGGRGLLGSGAEGRGTANIANRGLANLGEVNREQAIQGANANVDAAKLGYQGAIQQRGQDITQAQNMNNINLQVAQANFDAQMRQQEAAQQHNAQQQQFMQNLLLGLVRAY